MRRRPIAQREGSEDPEVVSGGFGRSGRVTVSPVGFQASGTKTEPVSAVYVIREQP